MTSYGFFLRPSVRRGDHPGRLYLRVVHGSQSRSITTVYRIWPDEWDADKRCLVPPRSNGDRRRQLLEYEDGMNGDLRRMNAIVVELGKEGGYAINDIMLRYLSIMSGNSVGAYAGKLANDLIRQGRERTAKAYRTAAARLIRFNAGHDVKLEHISPELMNDFQQMLKNEGRSMNTVSFYMRMLRAIYNKAVAEKRIPRRMESPFSGVYTGISLTRKLALTLRELAMLAEFDPVAVCTGKLPKAETADGKRKISGNTAGIPSAADNNSAARLCEPLRQALAMFMFCYHARGMCFVDMAYLKKSDIRRNTIHYRRRKTGQVIEIGILPPIRRALDYFATMNTGSEYVFPVITDQDKSHRLQYESGLSTQNRRLKRVAAICGTGKRLSTNCARHSWATVAKGAGLPLAVISEGLGHNNQKTTQIYLDSLEQSVMDRASKLVSEAIDPQRQTKDNRKKGYNNNVFRDLSFSRLRGSWPGWGSWY